MRQDFVLILVTASQKSEAEQIGQALVEEKLAACCNIVENISSIFHWKGKICREQECLLLIKSTRGNIDDIITRVKKLHSYEVPEIIALPIIAGSDDYLEWVKNEVC